MIDFDEAYMEIITKGLVCDKKLCIGEYIFTMTLNFKRKPNRLNNKDCPTIVN